MMRKYIAATWLITAAIMPASALDLNSELGGVGVDAGVSAGSQVGSGGGDAEAGGAADVDAGASVGTTDGSAGAGAGDAGGVDAGASVGTNDGSAGAGAEAGGAVDVDPGASTGTPSGSTGTPGGSTGATGGASAGAGTGNTPSGGVARRTARRTTGEGSSSADPSLPCALQLTRCGRDRTVQNTLGYSGQSLMRARRGTPRAVVRACQNAILSAAAPLGAVRVQAASAGAMRRDTRGALAAPIGVRIDYAGAGGIQVRQAEVRCRLDAAGRVIGVL